jgi:hypothetical protein
MLRREAMETGTGTANAVKHTGIRREAMEHRDRSTTDTIGWIYK